MYIGLGLVVGMGWDLLKEGFHSDWSTDWSYEEGFKLKLKVCFALMKNPSVAGTAEETCD